VANLKGRLERLEGGRKGRGMPIIIVQKGETSEEAVQKHLAQHPEDETEVKIVISCSGQTSPSAPPPPRPERKDSAKASGPAPIQITI